MRPSPNTSVLTAPAARASGDSSSHSAAAASLCGSVTFAPALPSAASPRTAAASPAGRHAEGDVHGIEPGAAIAALCMPGERECETGSPSTQAMRVVARIT